MPEPRLGCSARQATFERGCTVRFAPRGGASTAVAGSLGHSGHGRSRPARTRGGAERAPPRDGERARGPRPPRDRRGPRGERQERTRRGSRRPRGGGRPAGHARARQRSRARSRLRGDTTALRDRRAGRDAGRARGAARRGGRARRVGGRRGSGRGRDAGRCGRRVRGGPRDLLAGDEPVGGEPAAPRRWTTCIGSTRRRCARWPTSRTGSRTCRSRCVVAMRPDEPGTPVALLDELRAEPGARADHACGRCSRRRWPRSSARRSRPPTRRSARPASTASAGNPFYLRELLRGRSPATGTGADLVAVGAPRVDPVARRPRRPADRARLGADAVALARAMAVLDDGGRLADAAVAGRAWRRTRRRRRARRMGRLEILAGEDPVRVRAPARAQVGLRRAVGRRARCARTPPRPRRLRDLRRVTGGGRRPRGGGATDRVGVRSRRCARRRARPWPAPRRRPLSAGCAARWRRARRSRRPRCCCTSWGRSSSFSRKRRGDRAPGSRARARDRAGAARRIALDLSEILVASGQWERGVTAATAALDELGEAAPEVALELEAFVAVSRGLRPAQRRRPRPRSPAAARHLPRGDSWAARALAVLLAGNAAAARRTSRRCAGCVEHGLRDGACCWPSAGPAAGRRRHRSWRSSSSRTTTARSRSRRSSRCRHAGRDPHRDDDGASVTADGCTPGAATLPRRRPSCADGRASASSKGCR